MQGEYCKIVNADIEEIMPKLDVSEFFGVWRLVRLMLVVFIMGLIAIHLFCAIDIFITIWAGIIGIIGITLCIGLYLSLAMIVRYSNHNDYRLKAVVSKNYVCISNLESGQVIFKYQVDKIQYKISIINQSKYLICGKVKLYFAFCDTPCILLSSSEDATKQRVPVGYTPHMRDIWLSYLRRGPVLHDVSSGSKPSESDAISEENPKTEQTDTTQSVDDSDEK